MKKLLLIIALLLCAFLAKAQNKNTDVPDLDKIEIKEPVDSAKLKMEEIAPDYPGGLNNFMNYIQKNIRNRGNEGKVQITFVIDETGSTTDIKVIQSLNPYADAEAIRLIKNCLKWTPGIQNGKPVRVKFSIPINFGSN
jgi:protein TonB